MNAAAMDATCPYSMMLAVPCPKPIPAAFGGKFQKGMSAAAGKPSSAPTARKGKQALTVHLDAEHLAVLVAPVHHVLVAPVADGEQDRLARLVQRCRGLHKTRIKLEFTHHYSKSSYPGRNCRR